MAATTMALSVALLWLGRVVSTMVRTLWEPTPKASMEIEP
jgi:hypothetical protein